MYVIKAKYVQPNGLGWATKDGGMSNLYRLACKFDTEADAWTYLMSTDLYGRDEDGEWAWVEVDVAPKD